MTSVDIQIVISVITFVLSVAVSAAIGGMKWQKLQDKVENLSEDLKEIKGMFTIKLRD